MVAGTVVEVDDDAVGVGAVAGVFEPLEVEGLMPEATPTAVAAVVDAPAAAWKVCQGLFL